MSLFGNEQLARKVADALKDDFIFKRASEGKSGAELTSLIERTLREKKHTMVGVGGGFGKALAEGALKNIDANEVAKMMGGGTKFNVKPLTDNIKKL